MRSPLAERILAHREYWKGEFDLPDLNQNSLEALLRAAEIGFGLKQIFEALQLDCHFT